MPALRLTRIGNSLGIIVPKRMLEAMSWWQGDVLHIENRDGKIVLSNLTSKQIQPLHAPTQYGDAVSRKA